MSSLYEAAATSMPAGISRRKRDLPPADYLLKIKSYILLSKSENEKYETSVFEAGGHKWRLSFYPNGDKENNGKDYISLYLAIAETNTYRLGWEVNVNFKLFVYDQIEDKYLTIQDVDVKRFHEMKKEWGFAQFLPLKTFKESSNGYLVNDSCVFGVEVFVINCTGKWETISHFKPTSKDTFTWRIKNSKLYTFGSYAEVFNVQGINWELWVNPKKGSRDAKIFLSFYLALANWKSNPNKEEIYAKYKLIVMDQVNGNHLEGKTERWWFRHSREGLGHGFPDFMSLEDLKNPSKGFIVEDTLVVKVVFLTISTKEVSSIGDKKRK